MKNVIPVSVEVFNTQLNTLVSMLNTYKLDITDNLQVTQNSTEVRFLIPDWGDKQESLIESLEAELENVGIECSIFLERD